MADMTVYCRNSYFFTLLNKSLYIHFISFAITCRKYESFQIRPSFLYSGYFFTIPWTGIDARTPVAIALATPWVFGFGLFVVSFTRKRPEHLFVLLWIASVVYTVVAIHFLPRYGFRRGQTILESRPPNSLLPREEQASGEPNRQRPPARTVDE